MRFSLWRTAVLVACFGLLLGGATNAQQKRVYQVASDAAEIAGSSFISYNSFDPVEQADHEESDSQSNSENIEPVQFLSGGVGSSGGSNGLGLSTGFMGRDGLFFFGAQYIYARASFSEALAYVVTDPNDPQGGNQFVEYDFDYQSSYGFYGGWMVPDCGCMIIFDYARYQSDATANVTPQGVEVINGPYELNGQQENYADVDIQSYDLGVARTIPLGGCFSKCGPSCGDGCCDDSCCGCGTECGWCPYWDITWSAGLRFAEVGWGRNSTSFGGTPTAPTVDTTAVTRLNFDGVGGRVGLLGRRYFGKQRFASIYASGDISLLVGNMAISTVTQDVANVNPAVFSHRNSARRVIPVTEFEVGASAHIGDHVTLSSGYFIAAWHDLGMRDTYDFNGAFQLSHYDDANILGLDGFFARAEVAF